MVQYSLQVLRGLRGPENLTKRGNQNMKRWKNWLAGMAATLTLLMLLPVSALAASKPEITVNMPKTIEPDQQFAASVELKNNPGWAALGMEVTYDTQYMELVNLKSGNVVEDSRALFIYNEKTAGTIITSALYVDAKASLEEGNQTANGTVFTLYFQVKASASKGKTAAVNVKVDTFANSQYKAMMEPTTIKATASIGKLSSDDRKTQPHETKPSGSSIGGVVGTVPAATSSRNQAGGTQASSEGGTNVSSNGTAAGTAASGTAGGTTTAGTGGANNGTTVGTVTTPDGSVVENGVTPTVTTKAAEPEETTGNWWLAIVLGVVLIALVVVAVIVLRRRQGQSPNANPDTDNTDPQ